MAKRKQTAGERMMVDLAKELISDWSATDGYEGFAGWEPLILATWFDGYARRIDRAIKAAEDRGYERASLERNMQSIERYKAEAQRHMPQRGGA